METKLQQSKDDYDKLQRVNQDATAKYNEQLREKDVENSKLSNERDALQTRVTMLQAIPDRMIEAASNAVEIVQNGKTNWQQNLALLDSIRALTNDLSSLKSTVTVIPFINGVTPTNAGVLAFPADGVISIELQNWGDAAANDTVVDFMATVDATNLIADGWVVAPESYVGPLKALHRTWRADKPIEPSGNGDTMTYSAASIKFADNAINSPIRCRLSVYGINIKPKAYKFFLCPSNQIKDFAATMLP
jgi:hypothetical protein